MSEPVPSRSAFSVWTEVPTRWEDNDHYGHVNNVAYYSYVDTAVNGWLIRATGTDVRELDAVGLVVESACRFLSELSFPDVVHVGLACERLGRSSVTYRLGLFRGDADEPSALARFVHVYATRAGREVVPVPDLVRTAVEGLPAWSGGQPLDGVGQ